MTGKRDDKSGVVESADERIELFQGRPFGFKELLEVGHPGNELVRGEADQEESRVEEPADYYLYLGGGSLCEVFVV